MTACLKLRSELQALRKAAVVNMLTQFHPVQEAPALSHKAWQIHMPSLKASLQWLYFQHTLHQAVGNISRYTLQWQLINLSFMISQ